MQITNETRRSVMKVAWALFREAATNGIARPFCDALAGAWRFIKRMAAAKKPSGIIANGGCLEFRSPLVRSPIARRYGAMARVGGRSSLAYLTARVGS